MFDAMLISAPTALGAVGIDMDATIFVEALMFLFVLFFLHYVLFRPYLRAVEAREDGVGGAREEAQEMEARAEARLDEYESEIRQARRDAQDVRESLRNQGLQEHNEIVGEVRQELQDKLDAERDALQTQVDQARNKISERAEGLASAMVEKILAGT